MQSARLRSSGETSTSARCGAGRPGRPAAQARPVRRGGRLVIAAVSDDAQDRPSDQVYQRASSVPDSLPVADAGTDWREFRARLVASSRAATAPSSSSGSSGSIGGGIAQLPGCQEQQRSPARSAFNQLEWAHELSTPEAGCLLLAHPYMFRERQRYFYQAVILLLDHGPEGSYGIILNRPTQYKVSQIKSTVHDVLSQFSDNRLYMGGDCGDTAMVVLTHRSDIEGVTQVTEGVYHHNVHGAGAAVAAGQAEPQDFRFFAQYAGWAPGQLEEECRSGVWFCTAASPGLTLNAELSSGGAMWHAILQVMGGDHARVSDIIAEVEQRDLRAATARLQQAAAGSGVLPREPHELDADAEEQQQQQQQQQQDEAWEQEWRRRASEEL